MPSSGAWLKVALFGGLFLSTGCCATAKVRTPEARKAARSTPEGTWKFFRRAAFSKDAEVAWRCLGKKTRNEVGLGDFSVAMKMPEIKKALCIPYAGVRRVSESRAELPTYLGTFVLTRGKSRWSLDFPDHFQFPE